MLDVTLATVTWNSAGVLPGFLAAIPDAVVGLGSHELVIADNASTDSTLSVAARLAPDARVVRLEGNRGYAAGINAALCEAEPSRAVLVCNPDVRFQSGCVGRLYQALASDTRIGITVPRLLESDGRLAPSLRREPTVMRALGEALLGGDRAGRVPALGEVIHDPGAYRESRNVDWASGAVMLLSRECLRRTGPWDESFFLYSEETDFALRARDAGFLIRYVPEAVAVHIGGAQVSSPPLWALAVRNRIRLFGRRHGPVRTEAFRAAVLLNEGLRALTGRPTARSGFTAALRAPRS